MPRVEVVAEIANAHQGDPNAALDLALQSIKAGADAVKFQVYFAHELLVRPHPRFDHFQRQSFSQTAWQKLITAVKETGGRVYCDVFGLEALAVASKLGCDGYKVHSSDLGNLPLLENISRLSGKVFLSTGGSTAREIAFALNQFGPQCRPVLLHGFQSYPTSIEDSKLERLRWLSSHFGRFADVGYQDHISADTEFATTLPLLAIAMGASVIEKHVTLNRSAKGVDYYSSFEPTEFAAFVQQVRQAEVAIGGDPMKFSAAERTYRNTVKKRWVAARQLPAGKILAPYDLIMKRVPEDGLDAPELEQLAGRLLKYPVKEEEVLTRAHLNSTVWAMVVARFRSTRLPGKAMLDVGGMPALQHLLTRLQQAKLLNRIVFCTTTLDEDTPLAQLAANCGVMVYRGPVDDVLGRMVGALADNDVDVVLRVTGDDILVDPDYVDRGLAHHLNSNAEYSDLKMLPSGTEVEYFDSQLLRRIHRLAVDPAGTEYLTFYVNDHADQFRVASVPVDSRHARNWRLTLDTPEDYAVIRRFAEAMRERGKGVTYRLDDVVDYFTTYPVELEVNAGIRQRLAPPMVNTAMVWQRLLDNQ